MPEQIQELIDKIKVEGIQSAEERAGQIEHDAQARAGAIVTSAEEAAEEIIVQAKEEVKRTQEATQKALTQASRDMLLSLRQKMEQTLHKIVAQEVKDALSSDQLAVILTDVIKKTAKAEDDLEVTLSEKDLKKFKDSVISKLQKEVKGDIHFKSNEDVDGGFTISYDAGKSSYDFTDESLANYLSSFLNNQVASILQDSVK